MLVALLVEFLDGEMLGGTLGLVVEALVGDSGSSTVGDVALGLEDSVTFSSPVVEEMLGLDGVISYSKPVGEGASTKVNPFSWDGLMSLPGANITITPITSTRITQKTKSTRPVVSLPFFRL